MTTDGTDDTNRRRMEASVQSVKSVVSSVDLRSYRRRIVTERLARRDADDGSFDRAFWRRAGAEARFAAAWDMVAEVQRMRGQDVREPRLLRSVARFRRRRELGESGTATSSPSRE